MFLWTTREDHPKSSDNIRTWNLGCKRGDFCVNLNLVCMVAVDWYRQFLSVTKRRLITRPLAVIINLHLRVGSTCSGSWCLRCCVPPTSQPARVFKSSGCSVGVSRGARIHQIASLQLQWGQLWSTICRFLSQEYPINMDLFFPAHLQVSTRFAIFSVWWNRN